MVLRLALFIVLTACHSTPRPAAADVADDSGDDPEDPGDQLPDVAPTQTGGGAALLAEAQRELAAVRESHYEHHTRVDEQAGVFDYDCSGFVGYALSHAAPDALRAVQTATRRRPLAKDFEAVFASPPPPWTNVARADELVPGDVIAWLEPPAKHSRNTGHVVIVAGTPRPGHRNEYVLSVIDSSHSGHGRADARVRDHRNGLGTGELVLVVDSSGRPVGYRWSTAPHSVAYQTTIAFARISS